jgi:hypothetical protein
MDESTYSMLQLILFVVRIAITVYCVSRAAELNRSRWGWGIFGFLLPPVAFIWIQFMRPLEGEQTE